MEKYIFYSTYRAAGLCDQKHRDEYKNRTKVNPIVISILECSEQYIKELFELFELFETNKEEFADEIRKTISEDLYAIFSN